MATTSYASLFGTTGSSGGSRPGISTLYGQQERPKRQADGSVMAPAPTFAQMQQQGQARPAPQAAQPSYTSYAPGPMAAMTQPAMTQPAMAQPAVAPYQGAPAAAGSTMMSDLTSQLAGGGQVPVSRYDLPLFQQLRNFQRGQLEAEFGAARQGLEEEMARRGLAASSIGAGRFGDLAGQQARAMAGVDLALLKDAADAAAEDRRARDAMRIQLAQILSQVDPKNIGKMQQQLASLGLLPSTTGQGG